MQLAIDVLGFLVGIGLLFGIPLLLRDPTSNEYGHVSSKSQPKIVASYPGSSGRATWKFEYFEDGTGQKIIHHYLGGELLRTEHIAFTWKMQDGEKVKSYNRR